MRRVRIRQTLRPAKAAATTPGFAQVLRQAARATALRKTDRTRLKLLAAAADLLAGEGDATALRVADVASRAGLAHGTFYRYFADRQAIVEAVVADFARFLREAMSKLRQGRPGSPERVRATTLAYLRLFRANPGLMRCLMGLGAESDRFRAGFHALNLDWNGRVAQAIARRRAELSDERFAPPEDLLPLAYALGGMIDEFLAQLYLRRDPALAHLAEDEETVADLLADLWCRGAYGAVPAGLA
ncbi:MAG: TetR/AcrR family transcriptional regulator [Alphaproteobacteria bacterium]|nr:TetR/AcrR family transcriptional regulator [Alphaproteobacteria bacterium]